MTEERQVSKPSTRDQEIIEAGYDAVFTALPRSPTLQRIWRDHALGPGYPEGFENISFLTLPELERMASELHLGSGETVVDLGCGEGGPGLWIAREMGARLVGIDLSTVAVAHAAQRARELGLSEVAQFQLGTFEHTALPDGSAHAVMSVDALQYGPDKRAAAREMTRILSPGGRCVFTAFELDPQGVEGLPVIDTDPIDDYGPVLEDAGFFIEVYEEISSWRARLTETYEAVLAEQQQLADEMTDVGVAPLLMEVSLTLEHSPYRRRVLVAATR
jgi:ubiquinone/menaquinone biosynthesis C-methylase UbiE